MGVGYLTGQGGSGSNIKSVQSGTVANTTTADITISAVDMNSSIVLFSTNAQGLAAMGGNAGMAFTLDLTSSTNLRIESNVSYSYPINWEVVEFKNVKSIQRLTIAIPGTTGSGTDVDTTISAVNLSKTFIIQNGLLYPSQTGAASSLLVRQKITSPTNIRSNVYVTASNNRTHKTTVIEFK